MQLNAFSGATKYNYWNKKNIDISYKKKIEFIEEFCTHCIADDDRLFDNTIMSYSLNEISNIAQNSNNNMFPGIFAARDLKLFRKLFKVDSSNTDGLNEKILRMIPNSKIPFYKMIRQDG